MKFSMIIKRIHDALSFTAIAATFAEEGEFGIARELMEGQTYHDRMDSQEIDGSRRFVLTHALDHGN